jgi:hypothetical protein
VVSKVEKLVPLACMPEVDAVLRDIASEIEPTQHQKDGASRSHTHLRELLLAGPFGDRVLGTFLSGSYARGTAIRPLDDVDVIVEIDPDHWSRGFFSSLPPPDKVLDSFAGAIRRRYPQSSVLRQRRSVCLRLRHLCIDVVPAVRDSGAEVLEIPDRNAGEWIKTSPKAHAAIASRVNQSRYGLLKPLVKLAKYWNSNLPDSAHVKSFTIETIATRLFSVVHFGTLGEGMLLLLDFLASRFHPSKVAEWHRDFGMTFNWFTIEIPDIAGTGSNTAAYVDRDRAKELSNKARISRDRLLSANSSRYLETLEHHVLRALRA